MAGTLKRGIAKLVIGTAGIGSGLLIVDIYRTKKDPNQPFSEASAKYFKLKLKKCVCKYWVSGD